MISSGFDSIGSIKADLPPAPFDGTGVDGIE
jgi:hypothetical protein